jgi:hypothetical protein
MAVIPRAIRKPATAYDDAEADRAVTKLTEAQKKEAALPIEVFGIKTVSNPSHNIFLIIFHHRISKVS